MKQYVIPKMFKVSESSGNGHDFLSLTIEPFCSSIGRFPNKCVEHPFNVSLKGVIDLDDFVDSAFEDTPDPSIEVHGSFLSLLTTKKGFNTVSMLRNTTHLSIQRLDAFEDVILFFRSVFRVFESCIRTAFSFRMAADVSSACPVDSLIPLVDQVESIVDSNRFRKFSFNGVDVSFPHLGRGRHHLRPCFFKENLLEHISRGLFCPSFCPIESRSFLGIAEDGRIGMSFGHALVIKTHRFWVLLPSTQQPSLDNASAKTHDSLGTHTEKTSGLLFVLTAYKMHDDSSFQLISGPIGGLSPRDFEGFDSLKRLYP